MTTKYNSSDSSLEAGLERRVQTWVKNMAVIANSNPTTGTHSLRAHKSGVALGIGAWHVYLLSDSVCGGESRGLERCSFGVCHSFPSEVT